MTEGDGKSDFVEVGGLPIEVKLKLLGKEYTVPIFKGALYDELSPNFIFVDGTPNEDGTVNNQKMDYVPYSEQRNRIPWYVTERKRDLFGETGTADGDDGVHGLFKRDWWEIPPENLIAYETMNTLAINALIFLKTPAALDCFACFINGLGGNKSGIEGCYGNRKYVDIYYMKENILGKATSNSINECYKVNMQKSIKAAKSVLNEYNTEIYIAMSPSAEWDGCKYLTDFSTEEVVEAIYNVNAMGRLIGHRQR